MLGRVLGRLLPLRLSVGGAVEVCGKTPQRGFQLSLLVLRKAMHLDLKQFLLLEEIRAELLISLQLLLEPLVLNGQVVDDAAVIVGTAAMRSRLPCHGLLESRLVAVGRQSRRHVEAHIFVG